jgi:hypothetical protein
MQELLPGVFHWTAVHPKIHVEVSSYWIEDGGVLIDPLVPPDAGLEWFAERAAPPAAILLSNRHHYRESGRFIERFGCTVHCVHAGLHEFTHGEVVLGFEPGDELPGGVVAYEVGGLCPDDMALYMPGREAIAFADGLVRGPADGDPLGFVPDSLMDEPDETKRLLLESFSRVLADLDFKHVLLAHGEPLLGDGRVQLEELVRTGGRTAFEF